MSYHHLTPFERGQIEALRRMGRGVRAIARCLGRAASTVSRELRRGVKARSVYCAEYAQRRYERNRTACVRTQVLDHPPLRQYVYDKLADLWAPEQIANRLVDDIPHDGRMRVSPEAIYRRIYTDPKWNNAFSNCLRQGRKTRQHRGGSYRRRGPIANRVSIEERPDEVDTLQTYGHWEGDTLIGKNQQGAVVTLVERKGDWLRAVPVTSRNADEVAQAVVEALKDVPPHLVKTITFDNGSEFARHQYIAQQLEADIYFAHPYSAWQRARNENMNGLIRQYLPKKTSFAGLTRKAVHSIVNALNNRPRKKQHFRTPNEVFNELGVALEV
jgi:IS30 family transposase